MHALNSIKEFGAVHSLIRQRSISEAPGQSFGRSIDQSAAITASGNDHLCAHTRMDAAQVLKCSCFIESIAITLSLVQCP